MIQKSLQDYLPPHKLIYCETEESSRFASLRVAGIAVQLENGLEVFGSSSSFSEDPLKYAAFELLERYVVQTKVKPSPMNSEHTKFSISNGVAFHESIELASENAWLELVERNEILRSWYLNTPVNELSHLKLSEQTRRLLVDYNVELVDFSNLPGFSVVGLFAFSNQRRPTVYGFGSGRDCVTAVKKAEKEFWTRMGFVGDEEVGELPPFSTSPDFHQDFYLHPQNSSILLDWLNSNDKKISNRYLLTPEKFLNLTPNHWESFRVIQATAKNYIPLFFGDAPSRLFDFTHRCGIPHPLV